MRNTGRLTFIKDITGNDVDELWRNCFAGPENYDFMHAHVPPQYRVPDQFRLAQFFKRYDSIWLIKRIIENDIIGFIIHGNFLPGLPNNVGFNIGLLSSTNKCNTIG